jgi:beta-galactosidase GanA
MFLGTQYHRPPNPRPEDWERDLQLIKETGLELVRTWLYWRWVEPQEGIWVWEEYDRLADLVDRYGLKLFIQLMCDAPPDWLQEKYPDCRYLTADGVRLDFHSAWGQSVGGMPGPCFHHPDARRHGEEFMQRAGEHFRDTSCLVAWDLWNEVGIRDCFCEHTQVQWREWLQKKYGDVGTLNRRWQRSYTSFDEVRLPGHGVYADMFDRYEFEAWVRADLMRWRYETVRAVDPLHPLVSHYVGYNPLFTPNHDIWLIAQQVDQWGTSCYYDEELGGVALTFHATKVVHRQSRRAEAGWWLSEQTGGRMRRHTGDTLRSIEFMRSLHILAIAFGATGSIYWQWRPEIFGPESPHYGLTNIGGEPTARTAILKEFCAMLSRYKNLFDHIGLPSAQIGLLYEPRTVMYEQMGRGPRGEQWWWWRNFVGWYRVLLDRGYPMEILHAREVAAHGVPEEIRLLIAPMQVFEREGLIAQLADWTAQGNVLIAGPWFTMYDDQIYINQQCPPPDLFGVKQREVLYLDTPRLDLIGDRWLSGLGRLQGGKLIEDLEVLDAEPVGVCGDSVTMAWRGVGNGRAVYIGSFVGSVYDRVSAPQLGGLIDGIASGQIEGLPLRIRPPLRATGGAFVRFAQSDETLIIFVINPAKTNITTWLHFSPDVGGTITDLLTDEVIGTIEEGLPVRLTLAGEGARVLAVK